jgi:hypothetical protein
MCVIIIIFLVVVLLNSFQGRGGPEIINKMKVFLPDFILAIEDWGLQEFLAPIPPLV